jgi:hypothetical protein
MVFFSFDEFMISLSMRFEGAHPGRHLNKNNEPEQEAVHYLFRTLPQKEVQFPYICRKH